MQAPNYLRLFQFCVGAGDHLALKFINGTYAVVDFHYYVKNNILEPPFLSYLRVLRKTNPNQEITISFLCISHYDIDHIKGLEVFFEFAEKYNIKINDIWVSGDEENIFMKKILFQKIVEHIEQYSDSDKDELIEEYKTYRRNYLRIESFINNWREKYEKRREVTYVKAFSDLHGDLGDGLEAYAIAPLTKHIKEYKEKDAELISSILLRNKENNAKPDKNLISSIFFLKHHNFQLCFGGDAPKEVWEDSFEAIEDKKLKKELASDFIKVSHHGSKNSSSHKIWKTLSENKKKVYFGISAGKKYNHPSPQTIHEIRSALSDNNTIPVILATNKCKQLDIDELDLSDWFSNKTDQYFYKHKDSREGFAPNEYRSAKYRNWNENKGKDTKKGLLAYVYDIDYQTGKIMVSKGISYNISGYKHCHSDENLE